MQYILGETEWSGLKLKVDRRALIPRAETELLIELTVARCTTAPATILDLGTGTGAVALALATHYAEARVTAVDLSDDALALAKENTDALVLGERVEFIRSHWFTGLPNGASFDVVMANPPYLTQEETAAAEPEVRIHEPVSALTAADAGLADLRTSIDGAAAFLNSGGLLAIETGIDQHEALQARLKTAGYVSVESCRDLTGRDRFVFARKP